MADILVIKHSCIRLTAADGAGRIYFDPFHVGDMPQDGDVIFVTHDHHDHFSPEDIRRVMKPGAKLVMPASTAVLAKEAGFTDIVIAVPGESGTVCGIPFEAVPAYNVGKAFHTQDKGWVGYVVTLDGLRYYVAGDTDENPDNRKVRCDAALLPVGGKYTMNGPEAAAFAGRLAPQLAIPTHWGDIVGSRADAEAFCAALPREINRKIFEM